MGQTFRLNIDKMSWTQKLKDLCLLTESMIWLVAPSSCHCNFSAIINCTAWTISQSKFLLLKMLNLIQHSKCLWMLLQKHIEFFQQYCKTIWFIDRVLCHLYFLTEYAKSPLCSLLIFFLIKDLVRSHFQYSLKCY